MMKTEDEREHFAHWISTALPFDSNVGMAEHSIKTGAAWQAWTARAALEDFRCNEVLQQERQSLAMMLRMCASRLRNHGHQDLGDKAVDLLIRFGLQGSPLRAEPQKLPILPPSTELEKLAEEAGMVNLLNHGAASCVYSEGCHGVTQEHLERFAELVRAQVIPCDAQTAIHPDGSRTTTCGSQQMRTAVSDGSAFWPSLRAALRGLVDACDRVDLDRPTFGDCKAMRNARAALAAVDG